MLDEMETMINALAGVGNDIAHDPRTPPTPGATTSNGGEITRRRFQQLQDAADWAISGIDPVAGDRTALLRLTEIENSRRLAAFGNVAMHEILWEVCDVYEPIAEDKNIAAACAKIDRSLHAWGDRDLAGSKRSPISSTMPSSSRPPVSRSRSSSCTRTSETVARVSDPGRNQRR